MPAPNRLVCGLARDCWVSGTAGQAGQSPHIQRGKDSCISSNKAQGVWTGQPGINTALLSAACGHIKMWFLGGARGLLLLISFFFYF